MSISATILPAIESQIESSVRLGLIQAEPVSVGPSGPALDEQIDGLCRSLAAEHAGKSPGEIPGIASARELYRAFGVDPTKTRPSSEALLRRVIKGKPFPRISNAVDLCNFFSLRFYLSLGLYDAERIQGKVVLRTGRPGEFFKGIRKDEVHLQDRLVLADEAGAFGNPTSDSLRTSVTEATRSLWMVIFAPASYAREQLTAHVQAACEDMICHLAASTEPVSTWSLVLP